MPLDNFGGQQRENWLGLSESDTPTHFTLNLGGTIKDLVHVDFYSRTHLLPLLSREINVEEMKSPGPPFYSFIFSVDLHLSKHRR